MIEVHTDGSGQWNFKVRRKLNGRPIQTFLMPGVCSRGLPALASASRLMAFMGHRHAQPQAACGQLRGFESLSLCGANICLLVTVAEPHGPNVLLPLRDNPSDAGSQLSAGRHTGGISAHIALQNTGGSFDLTKGCHLTPRAWGDGLILDLFGF